MNKRVTLIAGLAAISLVAPFASHAATERQALDACATELTSQLGEMQGSPVRFNVGEGSDYSNIQLRGRTTFYIDAYNSTSQEIVARVDCEVGSNGQVRELKLLSTDAGSAHSRSW